MQVQEQQAPVKTTLLMVDSGGRQPDASACTATVLLTAAMTGEAVPGASVAVRTGASATPRTALSNAAGRVSFMVPADGPAARSCTLQILDVVVAGEVRARGSSPSSAHQHVHDHKHDAAASWPSDRCRLSTHFKCDT